MFDQTKTGTKVNEYGNIVSDDTPMRYTSNGTNMGYCDNDYELTNGEILYSHSVMYFQKSCKPNTGNAGNYYSWPASTAGSNISSGNASNSICPRGWQLTTNTKTDTRSWDYLLVTTYRYSSNDNQLRLMPTSVPRAGYYLYTGGTLDDRGSSGLYWSGVAYSSTNAYYLHFDSGQLLTQYSYTKSNGRSVRCVAR